MPFLFFVAGALAVMVGVGMVGYGVPINEFSFGNTLIVAGTIAIIGGLIVIAIGAAIGQLQRIAEMQAMRAPARSSRPIDMLEPVAAPAQGRIPFPPKPKIDPGMHEPLPLMDEFAPAEVRPGAPVAPTLRNPDMPAVVGEKYQVEEYEEASLSPRHPLATPAPAPVDLGEPTRVVPPPLGTNGSTPAPQPRVRPPPTSYFDSMWPAESRPAKRPVSDEAKPDLPQPSTAEVQKPQAGNVQPGAILKSGVVDGMAYTLYVDGSIEAELPQGTLRFASINELRSHLTKSA